MNGLHANKMSFQKLNKTVLNEGQLNVEEFNEYFRDYDLFHLQKIFQHVTKKQSDSKKKPSDVSEEVKEALTIQAEKMKESSSGQSKNIEDYCFRSRKGI